MDGGNIVSVVLVPQHRAIGRLAYHVGAAKDHLAKIIGEPDVATSGHRLCHSKCYLRAERVNAQTNRPATSPVHSVETLDWPRETGSR